MTHLLSGLLARISKGLTSLRLQEEHCSRVCKVGTKAFCVGDTLRSWEKVSGRVAAELEER